jgi:hypothetical protein
VLCQAVDKALKSSLNSPLSSEKIIFIIQNDLNTKIPLQTNVPSPMSIQIAQQCLSQLQAIQAIL